MEDILSREEADLIRKLHGVDKDTYEELIHRPKNMWRLMCGFYLDDLLFKHVNGFSRMETACLKDCQYDTSERKTCKHKHTRTTRAIGMFEFPDYPSNFKPDLIHYCLECGQVVQIDGLAIPGAIPGDL